MAAQHLALDSFWVDKSKYDDAERQYYERMSNATLTPLADEVAKARQRLIEIRGNFDEGVKAEQPAKSAEKVAAVKKEPVSEARIKETPVKDARVINPPVCDAPIDRSVIKDAPVKVKDTLSEAPSCVVPSLDSCAAKFLEKKMAEFQTILNNIQTEFSKFESRLSSLESKLPGNDSCQKPALQICPAKPAAPKKEETEDDDDDVDLFGSESEDDEAAAKLKEERLAAYNAKKSKKPVLIAKSSILLDIKPWDDETDMKAMEMLVRDIKMDGLLWGASKLMPLAYGIHKLQINCVVEDDKVSIDALQEEIEANEDYVQSVDIAAFNKI